MAEMARLVSDVDLAYQVLADKGSALYFRDLISQVLANKTKPIVSQAHAMAEVHTQINMDSRFVHLGKGMWGLAEWMPQRGTRSLEETAATVSDAHVRREKLLEGIQQDYPVGAADGEDGE